MHSTYPGSKYGPGVAQRIINQIPPHRVYIEPFAGHGGVAHKLRPAQRRIAVDLNVDALAYWKHHITPGVEIRNLSGTMLCSQGEGPMLLLGCGIRFLETFPLIGDEVVYADPPYRISARRSQDRIYKHEMDRDDHTRLLCVLSRLPCTVLLSGYRTRQYDEALKDWRRIDYQVMTHGGPMMESLWINREAPPSLHDFRYLGKDFRERERITRKVTRWTDRLRSLGPLERQAILSALRALDGP